MCLAWFCSVALARISSFLILSHFNGELNYTEIYVLYVYQISSYSKTVFPSQQLLNQHHFKKKRSLSIFLAGNKILTMHKFFYDRLQVLSYILMITWRLIPVSNMGWANAKKDLAIFLCVVWKSTEKNLCFDSLVTTWGNNNVLSTALSAAYEYYCLKHKQFWWDGRFTASFSF